MTKQSVGLVLADILSESGSLGSNTLVQASYDDKGILTLKLHGVDEVDYCELVEVASKEISLFTFK